MVLMEPRSKGESAQGWQLQDPSRRLLEGSSAKRGNGEQSAQHRKHRRWGKDQWCDVLGTELKAVATLNSKKMGESLGDMQGSVQWDRAVLM